VLAIRTSDYKLSASTNIIIVPGIANDKYSPIPLNVYIVGKYQASAKSGHLEIYVISRTQLTNAVTLLAIAAPITPWSITLMKKKSPII
jgi:hypothetical protein